MIRNLVIIIILFSFFGCKPEQINQKVDKKREGKWVDVYVQDNVEYKSIEYYKKGESIKKWKTYINRKIYKTEKYKNGICVVKSYYENGKLESKGNTKLEVNEKETHWFYYGDWKFYSDKGKLTQIKKYDRGELISEEKIEEQRK
jgi:antitoxin component YwqK of YwqJK toxin-antitoxin module